MSQPTFNAGALLSPKGFIKRATASWRVSVMEPITFTRRLKRCDPVVIFQMGKVASTSIYYSLKDVYPGVVVHTHWMKQNHHDWRVRCFYNEVFAAKRPLRVMTLPQSGRLDGCEQPQGLLGQPAESYSE
jgi:hypothetical protein